MRWIDRITSLVVLFLCHLNGYFHYPVAVMFLEYFAVLSYSTCVDITHQFYNWFVCPLFNIIMFYKCTNRLHCATLFLRTNWLQLFRDYVETLWFLLYTRSHWSWAIFSEAKEHEVTVIWIHDSALSKRCDSFTINVVLLSALHKRRDP